MVTRHKTSVFSSVLIAVLLAGCGGGGGGTPPPVVPRFAYVLDTFGVISSYAVDASTGQLRHNGFVVSPASTTGNVLTPSTAPSMAPPLVVSSPSVLHLIARSATPTIVAATIDGPTGILTPRSLTWNGIPLDIVGHPSGRFLYVLDATLNIQAAAVDATGNLTPVGAPISMTALGQVNRIAADPQGKFLIASARAGSLPATDHVGTLAIDAASGAPTGQWRRLTLSFQPGGIAVHPSGLCGVAIPEVADLKMTSFAISASGVPSGAAAITTTAKFVDVAFNPQGTALLALDDTSVMAFPVTSSSTCALGAATAPVTTGFAGRNRRLSVEPSGRFVYASDPQFNVISAMAIGQSPLSLTAAAAGAFTTRVGFSGFAPVFTSGIIGVSYLPLYLYSTNTATNDVSIFSIGSSGGGLTAAGSRTSLGTAPMAIAVDPWSRFAYVANRDSNNVAAFTINRSTGALSATVAPTTTLAKPVAVLVDPSGRFLFVAANGAARVQVFMINQVTGALSPSLPDLATLAQPSALAVDPTGSTLYVATIGGVPRVTSFTINQSTGAPLGSTGPSPTAAVGGFTGLAVDPAGLLVFAGDTLLNALNTYPVNTPVANIATPTPNSKTVARQPVSIGLDPLGRFLYVSGNVDAALSAFTMNRTFSNVTAGAVLSLGISPPRFPRTILVDPSGQFVYVADEPGQVMAFRVNQTTGALTFVGDFKVTTGGHPFALAIVRQPL